MRARAWLFSALLGVAASCGSVVSVSDGGTGGKTGQGGNGGGSGESCDQIAQDYATALDQAKSCTPGEAGQCQQSAPSGLGCNACSTYVNDASNLSAIQSRWTQAGCTATGPCSNLACVIPESGSCQATDAGGGRCRDNLAATPGT